MIAIVWRGIKYEGLYGLILLRRSFQACSEGGTALGWALREQDQLSAPERSLQVPALGPPIEFKRWQTPYVENVLVFCADLVSPGEGGRVQVYRWPRPPQRTGRISALARREIVTMTTDSLSSA